MFMLDALTPPPKRFANRSVAGQYLARLLRSYSLTSSVVFGIPRGGMLVAFEVARGLHAPLDVLPATKITSPLAPEYALAGLTESGHPIIHPAEAAIVETEWFAHEVKRQRHELAHRRRFYTAHRSPILVAGKLAIVVDDGVATGLTLRAALDDLILFHPRHIAVAVPIIPHDLAENLRDEGCTVLSLLEPERPFASMSDYYDDFPTVSDRLVRRLLVEGSSLNRQPTWELHPAHLRTPPEQMRR